MPQWVILVGALLVPFVAVFGAYIAYLQWRTARNRLKLDLFDRRVSVYEAARDFITSIMTAGRTSQEAEFKYISGIRGARWLYDDEITGYLDESIWHKALDLGTLQSELEGLQAGEQRSRNIRDQREIKKLLVEQL